MGLFNPGSGTGDARSKAARLDMLLGLLGFFAFMAAIQVVVLAVQGESLGTPVLLLVGLVVICWFVWRARRNTGV
jgi:Flp pilus assembly protein TadB